MITSLEKARRWFAKAGGITSIERPKADVGQRVEDPRLSAYLDPVGGPCSMEVFVDQGLSFNAFTLGPESRHPWYLAAQAFAEGADERARLMLEKYYELVRPASLVEWHDLATEDCPGLAGWPRHAWSIMPWKAGDPHEAIRKAETARRDENRKYWLDAGMEVGAKAFGPVSEAKLEIELKRIAELAKSISLQGFRDDPQDIDLGGRFLVADGCWRWLPTAGMAPYSGRGGAWSPRVRPADRFRGAARRVFTLATGEVRPVHRAGGAAIVRSAVRGQPSEVCVRLDRLGQLPGRS